MCAESTTGPRPAAGTRSAVLFGAARAATKRACAIPCQPYTCRTGVCIKTVLACPSTTTLAPVIQQDLKMMGTQPSFVT